MLDLALAGWNLELSELYVDGLDREVRQIIETVAVRLSVQSVVAAR